VLLAKKGDVVLDSNRQKNKHNLLHAKLQSVTGHTY